MNTYYGFGPKNAELFINGNCNIVLKAFSTDGNLNVT